MDFGALFPEDGDAFGLGERKWTKQHVVNEAEDGRVRADAESQSEEPRLR